MNKIIFVLILHIFCINLQAQSILFKGYLKSTCNSNINELDNYQIGKGSFWYSSSTGGNIATLPDTGIYILKSYKLAADGDSVFVHITWGINKDTIKQADIFEMINKDYNTSSANKVWSGWWCCDGMCDGYRIDYHSNGNKRLEGKFKKGKPVGELKFYNEDGKLKYVEYYNKRGRKLKSERVSIISPL